MLVGMATKRALLELPSRDELLAAVDLFGIDVPDGRDKDGIVAALVASRKVNLAQALGDFPRDRLKDLCRSLGFDYADCENPALVERLTGASAVGGQRRVRVHRTHLRPQGLAALPAQGRRRLK